MSVSLAREMLDKGYHQGVLALALKKGEMPIILMTVHEYGVLPTPACMFRVIQHWRDTDMDAEKVTWIKKY